MQRPLFIFEMANNHSGSVEHGKAIIDAIKEKCSYPQFDYAFKFQYRDLNTFIHKDYRNNFEIKNIKRFSETKLTQEQFCELKDYAEKKGFLTLCTPFDEKSVENIVEQNYCYIKIASCSFTDWPLLEKIASYKKPVIASCAGATLEEIINVVGFFTHRNIDLTLMHCVAEYPTKPKNLQLNQIRFLAEKFPKVRIGYSTHEDPNSTIPVAMAVAMGATVFEKHVGVETELISLNGYSANPQQVEDWLKAAADAYAMCGLFNERPKRTDKENSDLRALQRGVFAKQKILKGEYIIPDKVYYAIPGMEGQILANDMSKYLDICAKEDIEPDQGICFDAVEITNVRPVIENIYKDVTKLLEEAGVPLPKNIILEISHHYGIQNFYEIGTTIIDCVNREYCKKVLVQLPGQTNPTHYHLKKEETFQVLYGDIKLTLDGISQTYHAGDLVVVERGIRHSFSSKNGGVFEEISLTHYVDDSYYEDENIMKNTRRKTKVGFYKEDVK